MGVPAFFHSDGNINAVLPLIVASGFDGLQCIEAAAGMDIQEIKEKFGKDLCLMGNLDPSLLYDQDNQNDAGARYDCLRQAVTNLIASVSGTGGVIFGTSSGLNSGMSPERVDFMYRLVSELERLS